MARKPHILIIYTGGTIGMMLDYDTNVLRPFDFDRIYKSIPELKHLDCTISSITFEKPVDSSNMHPSDWTQIASLIYENYDRADGFVVLHGSDTMAYSASAVSFILQHLQKPVIFTGSQLPVGDLRTDAKENLITSIEIAATRKNGKPLVREVCIYFEYKLYRANRTTKISAEEFKAFVSPNYPVLGESGVHLKFFENYLWQPEDHPLVSHPIFPQNILLLKLFPGISRELWEYQLSMQGLRGVIIEAFGSGNAPTDSWFVQALDKTVQKGIPVIDITQCITGSVDMGKYETSEQLRKIGVIDGKDITTESAVTKLMYLLSREVDYTDVQRAFEQSIRGEMSI